MTKTFLTAALAAVLLALAGCSGDKPAAAPPGSGSVGVTLATPSPATVSPPAAEPEPDDFRLTPKITHRECFGTAGCNVDFEVSVLYLGPMLQSADTWRITYEVHGVDDGPLIDTLELTGGEFDATEQSARVKTNKTKLTVEVTRVEKAL